MFFKNAIIICERILAYISAYCSSLLLLVTSNKFDICVVFFCDILSRKIVCRGKQILKAATKMQKMVYAFPHSCGIIHRPWWSMRQRAGYGSVGCHKSTPSRQFTYTIAGVFHILIGRESSVDIWIAVQEELGKRGKSQK